MNTFINTSNKNEIWFIYDGECPLCTQAALALRIKEDYGKLHLLNARSSQEHPLMHAINSRGLDLDKGMVIYAKERFYHGKSALKFMARYGENKGFFNRFNRVLFRSDIIAKAFYPFLRGLRNALLKCRNVPQIDNLNHRQEPVFSSIFGDDWDKLPPALQKHYANRPYTNDLTVVKGALDVICAGPIKYLAPIFWLIKGIPVYNESNVTTRVNFESDPNNNAFHLKRIFYFKEHKTYHFYSRMVPLKNGEVIEIMRFGLSWRARFCWKNGAITLKHRGYAFSVLGYFIPLPLTRLIGAGNAKETAVDDSTFDMEMTITHPWWGQVYGYSGRFKIIEE